MVVQKLNTEIYLSTTIIENNNKHISKLRTRLAPQFITAFVCIRGDKF